MMKKKNALPLFALLCFGPIACGCGAKKIETTQVPNNPMSNGAPGQKEALKASGHYIVQKADCLWMIAGQPRIYGDSFEWPLIFKANRDQIKDPDLIYPRQDLRVEKGFSLEEQSHAKQMASATPKYAPHSKPRETLPVDYF
jgi:hypothetical protein